MAPMIYSSEIAVGPHLFLPDGAAAIPAVGSPDGAEQARSPAQPGAGGPLFILAIFGIV
jgi:hypothetical protein